MKAAPTLSKQLIFKYEHQTADFNIDESVQSAARVIAPLWPIETFAARHPWMGLEEQTFEQTARQLKQQLQVDIYPKSSISAPQNKGEKSMRPFLKKLTHWLDSHQPGMQRETAEAFAKPRSSWMKSLKSS
ncbi:Na-translocating system protein MpsB [Bacillus licheniformis]|nr:Na-translocating system protein MpsB [Bacillus licheniformis]